MAILAILICFVVFALFLFVSMRSHWRFVDVPLIFSCPADHGSDRQPILIFILNSVCYSGYGGGPIG